MTPPKSYEERFFGGSPEDVQRTSSRFSVKRFVRRLYGDHHLSRFRWLERQVRALGLRSASVLEVGCFDGRTVDHIPVEIERYVGLDAGWESGVKDGRPVGLEAARR
jgi:hypothetical protein